MTKSKRKRESLMFRVIPAEEMGPNFMLNLKAGLFDHFRSELIATLQNGYLLQGIISEKEKATPDESQKFNVLHLPVVRQTLIDCMIIIDSQIDQIIYNFQIRTLKITPDKLNYFTRPDEGIKYCIQGKQITPEMDRAWTSLKNFRLLRNQFSHYKMGAFYYNANQESFESFLAKLQGINLANTFHCMIDGKAGANTLYTITSSDFLKLLHDEALYFMKALIDLLFPEAAVINSSRQ